MADQALVEKSDEALLAEVQAGVQSSFHQLVERRGETFYRLAYSYLGQREWAEDVVQDAFAKLWQKPGLWNRHREAKFTTWFYRVVINLCIDEKRKKRTVSLPEAFEIADRAALQDTAMIRRQEQIWMDAQIKSLPIRQQTALNLCFYQGLSNQDAADIMGLKLKALQSLLMRAKETLKQRLAEREGAV